MPAFSPDSMGIILAVGEKAIAHFKSELEAHLGVSRGPLRISLNTRISAASSLSVCSIIQRAGPLLRKLIYKKFNMGVVLGSHYFPPFG